MGVIRQLLLSTGGGIISLNQQADKDSRIATVLIGLGGTGIDAIRTIKTEVYSRLKPDDPNEIIPSYKNIQFLGIDTAKKTIGETEHDKKENSLMALTNDEFLYIGDPRIDEKLKDPNIANDLDQLEWFRHEDIKKELLGEAGAGGVRQIGRFLFMNKSQKFKSELNSKIRSAREERQGAPLYIHVFAGLSGGTGSGTFLDVCYLIKHLVSDAKVFGYFFLPDVNLAKISEDNISVKDYIKKNGYAALQELDYCMQLGKNGGQLSQLYQGDIGMVDWKKQPVDLCHIIGAENVQGDVIAKPYEYAMNVTAEYVMEFLTKGQGNSFTLDQHIANVTAMMNTSDNNKEIASEVFYAIIGASCAKVPNREINTYLASALFSRLINVQENVATESEVESIAISALAPGKKNVKEIYDSLLTELKKRVGNNYEPTPLDWKYLRDFDYAKGIHDQAIYTHYSDQRSDKIRQLETNYKALNDYHENSLIQKVIKKLNELVLEKGPNYVFGVLDANQAVNILNIIDGLIAENNERWDLELQQTSLRMQERDDALEEFKAKMNKHIDALGAKKQRFENYLSRIVFYMIHCVSLETFDRMDKLLKSLKNKIEALKSEYYLKLKDLFNDLLETFKANKIDLDDKRKKKETGFVKELISINEIRDDLEDRVEKIVPAGFMATFLQYLMNHQDAWISGEENKIAKLVNEFFVKEVFADFANKAILGFLQMKYKTIDNQTIEAKLEKEYIEPLALKASPLFSENQAVTMKLAGYGKYFSISVPDSCTPIMNASSKCKKDADKSENKPSGLQDRIYMMSSYCGMALSAFNLLKELEERQFGGKAYEYGTHYYEGKRYPRNIGRVTYFNKWDELSPITPISMIDNDRLNRMPKLNERVKNARFLFEKAIELRILSDSDWYFYDYLDEDKKAIEELIEKVKEVLPNLDKPADISSYKVDAILAGLDRYTTISLSKTTMHLAVDGNDRGYADERKKMMFDHFFAAPAYMEKVKALVEFRENMISKIKEHKEKLEAKKEKIIQRTKDLTNYSDAIFSGVLSYNGAMITYEPDDIFAEPYVLCKRNEEEYPYYAIPIYQGYVKYQKLPQEIKEEIKKKVSALLDDASPQIREVAEKLNELLAAKKVKIWEQQALNEVNADEIKDVLKKFSENYRNWVALNL